MSAVMVEAPPIKEALLRVGRYRRLSHDPKQLRVDMREQQRATDAAIERLGACEVVEYKDSDKSAYSKSVVRADFDRLLSDVRAGRLDVIVAHDQDRYARRLSSWLQILEACQDTGTRIVFATTGELDAQSPHARMQSQFKGATDEYYSAHNGQKMKDGLLTMAENGKRNGVVPWGWKREYHGKRDWTDVEDPETAPLVREAVRHVNAGGSLYSLQKDWNARGIKTPKGGSWVKTNQIRQIILRPHNAGLLYRFGEYFGQADWPALVPESEWRQAVDILTAPSRTVNHKGSAPQNLLTSIMECAHCGATMRRGTRRGVLVYLCNGKFCCSRPQAEVDAYVRDFIVTRLAEPDAAEAFSENASDATQALADIAALHREREALEDRALSMSKAGYEKHWQRISGALEEAQTRLAHASDKRLGVVATLFGIYAPKRFDALKLEQKRAVIRALVTIRLHRHEGRGTKRAPLSPENIEIHWK